MCATGSTSFRNAAARAQNFAVAQKKRFSLAEERSVLRQVV